MIIGFGILFYLAQLVAFGSFDILSSIATGIGFLLSVITVILAIATIEVAPSLIFKAAAITVVLLLIIYQLVLQWHIYFCRKLYGKILISAYLSLRKALIGNCNPLQFIQSDSAIQSAEITDYSKLSYERVVPTPTGSSEKRLRIVFTSRDLVIRSIYALNEEGVAIIETRRYNWPYIKIFNMIMEDLPLNSSSLGWWLAHYLPPAHHEFERMYRNAGVFTIAEFCCIQNLLLSVLDKLFSQRPEFNFLDSLLNLNVTLDLVLNPSAPVILQKLEVVS